jgi:inosose dehydratase
MTVSDEASRWGLRAVLHPHAGTYIEFADEIDRALDDIPREAMGLCIDTGHLALARIDPAQAVKTYAGRIDHVHLKDLDAAVHRRVGEEGIDFWRAIDLGLFCPIGTGRVDFAAVLTALDAIGYAGVAILEQDRNPNSLTDPRNDLEHSLAHLRGILDRDQIGRTGSIAN